MEHTSVLLLVLIRHEFSVLQEAIERGYAGITTMLMKAIAEVNHLGMGGEK